MGQRIFKIDGYWLDDKCEFNDYLVTDYDNTPDGYEDYDFFYYGISETNIKEIMEAGDKACGEFAITSYREVL